MYWLKHVINSDILLLLSQASMKWADMNLNFKDDTVSVFGKTIELVATKNSHYAIPLTVPCQIIHSWNANVNVTLAANQSQQRKDDTKTSWIICTCIKWEATETSQLCWFNLVARQQAERKDQIHMWKMSCVPDIQKTPPQPIVGLPLATKFKECVAMDLKFYKGKILLHIIDHSLLL